MTQHKSSSVADWSEIFSSSQERDDHYKMIKDIYSVSPSVKGIDFTYKISHAQCEISHKVNSDMYNSGQVMHGMYFFKLIDEAAHGAAMSVENTSALATTNLSLNLIRPATSGIITAKATLVSRGKKQYIAQATLYNQQDKVIANGIATFMKSSVLKTFLDS